MRYGDCLSGTVILQQLQQCSTHNRNTTVGNIMTLRLALICPRQLYIVTVSPEKANILPFVCFLLSDSNSYICIYCILMVEIL